MSGVSPEASKLFDLIEGVAPSLARPLYPVCSLERSDIPVSQASCVVIVVGSERFVITAGHTADIQKTLPLGIILSTGVRSLEGRWLRTRGVDGAADRLDLAVLVPAGDLASALANEDAVKLEYLATLPSSHELFNAKSGCFLTMGYPISQQPGQLIDDSYRAKVWQLVSRGCSANMYPGAAASVEHHLLLEFDKRRVSTRNGQAVAPDPIGSSGGAVWWLRTNGASTEIRLVAIPTAWREHASQLLATRIYVALAAIWKERQGLRPELDNAD